MYPVITVLYLLKLAATYRHHREAQLITLNKKSM